MKGFELMWCPFKSFSVVEYRVVVYTDPLDLVLKLTPVSTTFEDLFDLPLRFLVVDNWEWRVRVLSW
jgi:hypothetical protein